MEQMWEWTWSRYGDGWGVHLGMDVGWTRSRHGMDGINSGVDVGMDVE